jgi:hypothetical protein
LSISRIFEKDLVTYLFEADSNEVEEIKRRNADKVLGDLHVLPYCLGGQEESRYLNINVDPLPVRFLKPVPDTENVTTVNQGLYFWGSHLSR